MSDASHPSESELIATLSSKVVPSWHNVSFHLDYVRRLCDEGYIAREALDAFLTLVEARFRIQQQQRPRS